MIGESHGLSGAYYNNTEEDTNENKFTVCDGCLVCTEKSTDAYHIALNDGTKREFRRTIESYLNHIEWDHKIPLGKKKEGE